MTIADHMDEIRIFMRKRHGAGSMRRAVREYPAQHRCHPVPSTDGAAVTDEIPKFLRRALSGFSQIEKLHGWAVGWNTHYPNIVAIACECGHMSIRDYDEVEDHVCPACGRGDER